MAFHFIFSLILNEYPKLKLPPRSGAPQPRMLRDRFFCVLFSSAGPLAHGAKSQGTHFITLFLSIIFWSTV